MGLIREAAGQGDLDQGLPLPEQGAGVADASIQQIGVGGHAVMVAEGAHEVGGGEPGHRAQFGKAEGAGAVVLHQLGSPLQVLRRAIVPAGRGEPGQQLATEQVAGHLAGQGIRPLHQLVMEVQQALVEQGIPARRHVEGAKRVAEASLFLLAAQPVGIEVEHQIGPGLSRDGIAGVHLFRVHQHQGARADLLPAALIEVVAVAAGDGTDGEVGVAVLVVADVAAILHRPRLDEGQGRVVPETVVIRHCPCPAHDQPPR